MYLIDYWELNSIIFVFIYIYVMTCEFEVYELEIIVAELSLLDDDSAKQIIAKIYDNWWL